jgi:phosphonate transport system substrate-binding protein
MTSLFRFLLFSLALAILTVRPAVSADDDLTLAIHPFKSAVALHKAFTPLVDYLTRELGRKVNISISKDYQTHIERVGNNEADIAYLGPASYIKLVDKFGKRRILARLEINGSPTFRGYIITRADSPLRSLKSLVGKRFAFGSPASTMSHLVPRYMLWKAGVDVSQFAKYDFLGNHTNVALSVLTGKFDAGAVKEAIYDKYKQRGLRILAETDRFSEHLFVAGNNMPDSLAHKLQAALLNLHRQPDGKRIMATIKGTMTALVPAKDKDYDNLRTILRTLKDLGIDH